MQNIPKSELVKLEQLTTQFLDDVAKTVKWADNFLDGDIKERTLSKIKKIRRDAKKIQKAIGLNPSSALYGESQVGKSYLIKNLLSRQGQPFLVKDRSTGESYDFLEHINPKGDGVEATSIVTRFSTNVSVPDDRYPVTVHLMSLKDIILMLCDTYFFDVIDHQPTQKNEAIKEHIDKLIYGYGQSIHRQSFVSEDDIYDLKEYFEEHFKGFSLATDIINSSYWSNVAKLIEGVEYRNWVYVFEILWGKNQVISSVFTRLIEELKKVNFAEVVYAEFKAILRENGTLLHVARLKDLSGTHSYEDVSLEKFIPDVQVIYQNGPSLTPVNMEKSALCALTAELIIEVEKDLEQEKPFLIHSDLLDFPGARSRMKNQESKLSESHIGYMVLRGKVAYIFNKYSAAYFISNLLFCNKNLKIEVTYIPKLLNSWIENYIGKDPQVREQFLRGQTIPPLFIIYTFFNQDLRFDPINDKSPENLTEKWIKRFKTIFEAEILTKNYDWHYKWSTSEPLFKNNYLLRDFHYSGETFKGYAEEKEEVGLLENRVIPSYYDMLKKSFLDFDFVKNHFFDPLVAWEESATVKKDGSDLILKNLTQVSTNYARTMKFTNELDDLQRDLLQEISRHYHSDNADQQIRNAAAKAGELHLNIDDVFGRDPYGFGNFINAFIIKEGVVYNYYREELSKNKLIDRGNVTNLVLIRNSNPNLSIKKSYEDNIAVLMATYNKGTAEETERFFAERNIDLNELFYGEANSIKNNSAILAEGIRDYWMDKYLVKERFQLFIDNGFSSSALEDLFTTIRLSFDELHIVDKIADRIRDYVDRYDKIEEAEEMIADMSAAIINRFITTFGWDDYTSSKIAAIQSTNNANGLHLNFENSRPDEQYADNEDISMLFDNMYKYYEHIGAVSLDKNIVKKFPNIRNIDLWTDRMKIAFVANCSIPTYDIMANQELGKIIKEANSYKIAINA